MPSELNSLIDVYVWDVAEGLPMYDESDEVIELFIRRELIEDAILDGQTAPLETLQQLEEADKMLIRRRRRVVRRFPELFSERPLDLPRCYWWWYLDEGPQVREHVKGVA